MMYPRHTPALAAAFFLLLGPAWLFADDYAVQKTRIDELLSDPGVKEMHAGVCIVDVRANKTIYALREAELFIPASNQKLLTTAAALDQLGADFSYQTTFAMRGQDLLVIAGGDAGLGDDRISKKHNTAIEAPFLAVVAAMKKAGIAVVPGDLIVDISVFDTQYFNPNWPPNQRDEWYQAEVAGLNFNDNCIDLRCAPGPADGQPAVVEMSPETRYVTIVNKTVTDSTRHVVRFQRKGVSNTITASGNIKARGNDYYSVPITDPPAFAMQTFVDLLAKNGIGIAGKVRWERVRKPDGAPPEGLAVLYRHQTSLADLVWRSNTFSQNFVAECIFKSLGAYDGKSVNPVAVGSWKTGQAAVQAFLKRQKFANGPKTIVDDGSGLSKSNQLSPGLLAELLVRMAGHKHAEVWFDSLASSGTTEGTLRKRFRALDGDEMVLAKTGTLANAVALSGYVHTKANQVFAFSVLFDRFKPGEQWKARAAADKIVTALLGNPPAGGG